MADKADKTDKAAKPKTRKSAGGTTGRAKKQTKSAVSQTKKAVERQAQEVAVRGIIREAPYAGLGLGRVVADAVRGVEATSLPDRLRRSPGAVVSKVGSLGPNAKVGYLNLAARGRGARLQKAGKQAADSTAKQTKAAASRTKTAASATSERAKGVAGKLKGAASRTSKPADAPTGDEPSKKKSGA
jgi:hypothetical protein